MKKKVLLLSIIAIFLLSSHVLANTNSKVGKKITAETPVYLDGVQLVDAVVTEGTSFAPVRAIAEALGVEVKYEQSKEGSAIKLTSPKKFDYEENLKESRLKAEITGANTTIERLTQRIDKINRDLETETMESIINFRKNDILEAKEQIIIEQENIIKYTNELLALESAK